MTSTSSAAAADTNKKTKYSSLTATHLFIPIAVETNGVWCSKSAQFIEELGKQITAMTNEPLETKCLFKRLSVTLQRGKAVTLKQHILRVVNFYLERFISVGTHYPTN